MCCRVLTSWRFLVRKVLTSYWWTWWLPNENDRHVPFLLLFFLVPRIFPISNFPQPIHSFSHCLNISGLFASFPKQKSLIVPFTFRDPASILFLFQPQQTKLSISHYNRQVRRFHKSESNSRLTLVRRKSNCACAHGSRLLNCFPSFVSSRRR